MMILCRSNDQTHGRYGEAIGETAREQKPDTWNMWFEKSLNMQTVMISLYGCNMEGRIQEKELLKSTTYY